MREKRALRRRPLLVTTNLGGEDLSHPRDQRYARLFDRVRELCPHLEALKGSSLRGIRRQERENELGEIIGN